MKSQDTRKGCRERVLGSQCGSDQGIGCVLVVHPGGMLEDIISVSGFPNLRVLELVQHVYVIARGELMGVALKNVSFCQQND